MPNEWYTKFYHRYETGAREKFESVCFEILAKQFPSPDYEVFKPRISQGDKGIDIRITNLKDGQITIYQCKFFDYQKIDSSQKRQIEKSFQRAVEENRDKFQKWILCVPLDLSVEEDEWWNIWKSKKEEETGLRLELLDGSSLILLSKSVNLYDSIFEDDFKKQVQEIHASIFNEGSITPIKLPAYENPKEKYVIGFLLDGSEAMTNAIISNKFENNEILLERIFNQLKLNQVKLAKGYSEYLKEIQVFFLAYTKVENILSGIIRKNIKNHCIDLLGYADNERYYVMPDLLDLNLNFAEYKKLVLKSVIMLGSGKPFLRGGLKTSIEYFDKIPEVRNKILVIFTTGEITKQNPEEIEIYSQQLKDAGVVIFSIYLQKDMSSFGKEFTVYNSPLSEWREPAHRAFNLCSPIDSNSVIYEKIQLLSNANEFPFSNDAKLFFPLIPEKTLTFLKYILFGSDDDD